MQRGDKTTLPRLARWKSVMGIPAVLTNGELYHVPGGTGGMVADDEEKVSDVVAPR